MTDSPTVAVIIPMYNCAEFIEEALVSVEQQTRLPDKVVVVDDGSTDDGGEIVKRFIDNSALSIQLVVQSNGGIASARNTAIRHCKEDFIVFLDGDDTIYPSFIERVSAILSDHEDLVIGFSDRDVVNEHGELMRRDLDEPKFRAMETKIRDDGVTVLSGNPFMSIVSGNLIPVTLIVRRSAFEKVGGFDETQRFVEDRYFLLRLSKLGQFGFIDEPLGIWRRHGGNASGSSNAFKMAFYADSGLEKLEREATKWSLTEAELNAVHIERKRIAGSLLYSASAETVNQYFSIAWRLLCDGRVSWVSALKSLVRYVMRRTIGWMNK